MKKTAKRKHASSHGKSSSGELQLDPRFVRMCDALAVDRRFAKCIAEFRRATQAGLPGRFGSTGLRVNGKIFAMAAQGTLVVKLPRPRVDELVESGRGERFDPGHGRVMREWFVVTSSNLAWVELTREAHAYVASASKAK